MYMYDRLVYTYVIHALSSTLHNSTTPPKFPGELSLPDMSHAVHGDALAEAVEESPQETPTSTHEGKDDQVVIPPVFQVILAGNRCMSMGRSNWHHNVYAVQVHTHTQ